MKYTGTNGEPRSLCVVRWIRGHLRPPRSPPVNAQGDTNGRPALLKALFILVGTLVLVAMGYAAWIVISYWGRVSV
jgi:hypothetical protein